MKIFTYIRTLWHEFWMYMLVGAPSKDVEEVLAPRVIVVPPPKFEANATANIGTEFCRMLEKGLSANNPKPSLYFGSPMPSGRRLWVYNVSRVDHKFDHPMLGNVTIPANKTKKRYSLWTSFPEVVMGTNYDIDENKLYPHMIKGEYFVNDLINPDNIYGDSALSRTSIGRDLSVRGVFWSYSNPPKPAEVSAAVKKLKAYYTDLLERARVIYECTPISEATILHLLKECPDVSLEESLRKTRVAKSSFEITPEHHEACEYFKVTTPWHPVLEAR